jgi:hypothetical protein
VHRRAVVLHYLGDLPVDEIASELGVPRGTVLSWLHRSRVRLADLLREDAIPVRPAPAPERVVAKTKRRRTTRLAAAIAALLTGATAAAAAVPAIVANLPHPVTRIEEVVWTGGTITLPATTDAEAHECPTGRRDIEDGSSTEPVGYGRIEPQSTSPSEWTALWIDGSSAIYGDLTGDGVNEAVLLVDCDNGTDFANPATLIRRQHLLVITRRGGRLVALGYLGPRFARIIDYRIENGAVRAWFKPTSTMIGDSLGRVDAPKYGASFAWDGRSMRQVAGPTQVGGIPFNLSDHDPTDFAALDDRFQGVSGRRRPGIAG